MKTSIKQLCALASMLFLFSACEKDSLVDNVNPEYTADVSSDMRSTEMVQFELWQQIDILQPDCEDPIMTSDSEGNDDEVTKTSGCMGIYGLTGYDNGQGWIQEYGRFLSVIELRFDADRNQVNGTIQLKFPADSDMLVLKAVGEIHREVSSEDGTNLMIHVLSMKGTGRFKYVDFSGELTIMDADQIFDGDATDYYATVFINGAFGK